MDEPVFDRETALGLEMVANTLGWSVAEVLALAQRQHPDHSVDQAVRLLLLDHYQRRLRDRRTDMSSDLPLPEGDYGDGLRDEGEPDAAPDAKAPSLLSRALAAVRRNGGDA